MTATEKLIEKYPKIFQDYIGNPGRVNWYCPEGWFDLVDRMCSRLQWYTDKNNSQGHYPQVTCSQMKEKFGGLRFYTNGVTPWQDGTIGYTESLSNYICMECGSNKNVKQTSGWVTTLCEEHFPKDIDNGD